MVFQETKYFSQANLVEATLKSGYRCGEFSQQMLVISLGVVQSMGITYHQMLGGRARGDGSSSCQSFPIDSCRGSKASNFIILGCSPSLKLTSEAKPGEDWMGCNMLGLGVSTCGS
jgi:hypothetical protein